MQEIRFNQPTPVTVETPKDKIVSKESDKKNKVSGVMSFFKLVFKILLLLAVVYGILIGSRYFINSKKELKDAYVAIFLFNDQVYFGKILENRKGEIVLKDVYYLQGDGADFSPNGAAVQGSGFTLIKLGQELHGPEDLMYINKNQMLFYEYLRPDSQLVQAIKNYKN